jgi:hypothetical protein
VSERASKCAREGKRERERGEEREIHINTGSSMVSISNRC